MREFSWYWCTCTMYIILWYIIVIEFTYPFDKISLLINKIYCTCFWTPPPIQLSLRMKSQLQDVCHVFYNLVQLLTTFSLKCGTPLNEINKFHDQWTRSCTIIISIDTAEYIFYFFVRISTGICFAGIYLADDQGNNQVSWLLIFADGTCSAMLSLFSGSFNPHKFLPLSISDRVLMTISKISIQKRLYSI